jgi:hypothetical protein
VRLTRRGLVLVAAAGAAAGVLAVALLLVDDGDDGGTLTSLPPSTAGSSASSAPGSTSGNGGADGTTTATLPTERDAALWPFSSASPWNTPLGSGAQYADESDPRTADIREGDSSVNAGMFSHPIYQATDDDPEQLVHTHDGDVRYRIPADAQPALPAWGERYTDAHLHVIDPTRSHVDECFQMRPRLDGAWDCTFHQRIDLYGDGVSDGGTRAYGGSAIGGLIRIWELEAGTIPHALAFAMPNERMQQGPVWPASREDNQNEDYQGTVPMGTLVAIPPDVDLEALDLTPAGLVLARALQDYGAYLVDGSRQFVFYTEPSAEGTDAVDQMRVDTDTLQDLLVPVTNNTPTSVGGGGAPRVALAPELAP